MRWALAALVLVACKPDAKKAFDPPIRDYPFPTPTKTADPPGPARTTDQVIASLQPNFKKCYQAALTGNPDLVGHVDLQTAISDDGWVRSIGALPNEAGAGLPPNLVLCLSNVIAGAHFSGGVKALTIPVTFDKGP